MSINIYTAKDFETIKTLSENDWELPSQMYELEKWLAKEGRELPTGNYVADIGFIIREEAIGGGAVLNSNMIKTLGEIGMEIYFSEYNTAEKE